VELEKCFINYLKLGQLEGDIKEIEILTNVKVISVFTVIASIENIATIDRLSNSKHSRGYYLWKI